MKRIDRRRVRKAMLASIVCLAGLASTLSGAEPAGSVAAGAMTPPQRADSTPKGELKNPYSDTDAAAVAEGSKRWQGYGCSGCHGAGGGGDMCPPVADGVWIYGGDDDALFRLVAYGSEILQSKGYSRQAMENVVAPMPQMGMVVKTDDDLWKILAFVRSIYHGPPDCKYGCKSGG